MTRRRRDYRRRRGTTLVLFAILIFALLPMMALVLDLGIVRVTRRQMQTAANVAALEGLRHRDSQTDKQRREKARDTVKQLFDDNLDPTSPSTGFAAGPSKFLVDGTGTPLSGKTYRWSPEIMTDANQLPVVEPYRPNLRLNDVDNKQHGDLVAGEYNRDAAVDPDALFTEKTDTSGMTPEYYKRSDFTTADVADAATARSFLARLRRTPLHDNSTEPDDEADVSSAGPPVPFVFGRGGLASGGTPDPHALWNQRETGVTVRATSIADARPALTAGPATPSGALSTTPTPSTLIPGIAPFAFTATAWNNLAAGPTTIYVSSEGLLSLDGTQFNAGILFGLARLANLPDAAATTLAIESFSGWPAGAPVKIRVGPEIMHVTPNATLSWPITARGVDGTQIIDHTTVTNPAEIQVRKRIIRHEPIAIGYRVYAESHMSASDRELQNTFNLTIQSITAGWPAEEAFVPVYKNFASAGDRVFAFGRAQITPLDAMQQDMLPIYKIQLTKQTTHLLAAQNATVCVTRSWNSTGVNATDVDQLFRAASAHQADNPNLVLAPALVRTLGKLKNP